MIYRIYIKRLLDIVFSAIFLFFLSPLFLTIAILVRFKLGSPILFEQKRPGKHGKLFVMRKFRSMTNEKNQDGEYIADEKRLTNFGRTLRSTSLDELPELISIFIGEMSFVGPRPLLKEYLPLYNEFQNRRHEVRPGLTGLAQINGRNSIGWKDRFSLDVEYVDNVSFLLDFRIILQTFKKVFLREGIVFMEDETIYEYLNKN